MSQYAVQQAIFDHLRALERPDVEVDPKRVATEGYRLTDEERLALETGDVAQFYRFEVHPVLINAYCRANGWRKADYRVLFPAGSRTETRSARWQRS